MTMDKAPARRAPGRSQYTIKPPAGCQPAGGSGSSRVYLAGSPGGAAARSGARGGTTRRAFPPAQVTVATVQT